jgi:hypothetical protein
MLADIGRHSEVDAAGGWVVEQQCSACGRLDAALWACRHIQAALA